MEFIDLARYFGALILVLALVGGAALATRRFGLPGIAKPQSQKRLVISETLMMGPRQRLFILRRDDVEHLILTGPDGSTVIESNFSAPRNASPVQTYSPRSDVRASEPAKATAP